MLTIEQALGLQGRTLLGASQDRLGTLDCVYADRADGEPTFATVRRGAFGRKARLVPLTQADLHGDDVVVPYAKKLVKRAPRIDPTSELSPEQEQRLYRHYGVTGPAATTAPPATAPAAPAAPPAAPAAATGTGAARRYVFTRTETDTVQVTTRDDASRTSQP